MRHLIFCSSLLFSTFSSAGEFSLTSTDISPGEMMLKQQEFAGFGCTGHNQSPQLAWKNAPEGTKSFALTVHDPDAPTGSGWWHWQIINIPADVRELKADAGNTDKLLAPVGSQQLLNDYSQTGFGGACPPEGHGPHRYQFTLYGLKTDKLTLPQPYSSALVGYMIKANALGSVTLEALYQR